MFQTGWNCQVFSTPLTLLGYPHSNCQIANKKLTQTIKHTAFVEWTQAAIWQCFWSCSELVICSLVIALHNRSIVSYLLPDGQSSIGAFQFHSVRNNQLSPLWTHSLFSWNFPSKQLPGSSKLCLCMVGM